MNCIAYIATASTQLSPEEGRKIIDTVNGIIRNPSTIGGTPDDNVIIAICNPDGYQRGYTTATHVVGGTYPLTNERNIHCEKEHTGNNQLTSPDGVCWVMEGTRSFHDPCKTPHPHVFVDEVHVILVCLPKF